MAKRTQRSTLITGGLAAFGVWLAIDALLAGSLWKYQLFGLGLGGACVLPLATLLVFGDRARRLWRRLLFATMPLLVLLLVAEAGVRAFGPTPELPGVLLRDARLGHRNEPGTEGTDARGFRNATARERTDVLFVGDSQTWGFGVDPDSTFAAQFGTATGRSSYQMANGSWGPVQYVELARQGFALQPKWVVVTVYLGNDLVDAHDYAGLEGAADLRTAGVDYTVRDNPEFHGSQSPNLAMALVDGALACSRVLDFAARVVKSRLQGGQFDAGANDVVFSDVRTGTILRPAYRLPAVDRAHRGPRDGLLVTQRAFVALASLGKQHGAEVCVLLLPTKELVYAKWLQSLGRPMPELAALQAAEQVALASLRDAATILGLRCFDLTNALQAELQEGRAPWPASGDGHLSAHGHRTVARFLLTIAPR